MRAMQSSRFCARSVSTTMVAVSTGRIRTVASTTIPVSPMPPAVAQNRSGSLWAESSTRPAGVASDMRSTCEQNEPSRWWFLPWMSAAMAPPTVT